MLSRACVFVDFVCFGQSEVWYRTSLPFLLAMPIDVKPIWALIHIKYTLFSHYFELGFSRLCRTLNTKYVELLMREAVNVAH